MKKIILLISILSIGYCNHVMGMWWDPSIHPEISRWVGASFNGLGPEAYLSDEKRGLSDSELESAIESDLVERMPLFEAFFLDYCPVITTMPLCLQHYQN